MNRARVAALLICATLMVVVALHDITPAVMSSGKRSL
jgi:hypothetical protein